MSMVILLKLLIWFEVGLLLACPGGCLFVTELLLCFVLPCCLCRAAKPWDLTTRGPVRRLRAPAPRQGLGAPAILSPSTWDAWPKLNVSEGSQYVSQNRDRLAKVIPGAHGKGFTRPFSGASSRRPGVTQVDRPVGQIFTTAFTICP